MKHLPLMSALILFSCLRGTGVPPAQVEEDKSIVFPMFFGVRGADIDAQGGVFEMDSIMLRALTTATHDFLSLSSLRQGCWSGPEGHRYEIILQGNIIFIRLSADLINCWHEVMPIHYGATYAISTDGRILRRIFSGDPDEPNPLRESDAGVSGALDDRDYSDVLGATWFSSDIAIPPSWLDGGFPRSRLQAIPDGGVQSDGGIPMVFPKLFGAEGTAVGTQGMLYRMEGITLRALLTAIDDFRPVSTLGKLCGSVPEEQLYRIADQGHVIFIEIAVNTGPCKPEASMMSHGMKYAISPEGRILRRIFAGTPVDSRWLDGGSAHVPATAQPVLPDGGTRSDGGSWMPPSP